LFHVAANFICHSGIIVLSSAEEMLQITPAQRLRGGSSTTVLPSGGLETHPRESSNIFKPQCEVRK